MSELDGLKVPVDSGGPGERFIQRLISGFLDEIVELRGQVRAAEAIVTAARESGFHSCPPIGNPQCSICTALRYYAFCERECEQAASTQGRARHIKREGEQQ